MLQRQSSQSAMARWAAGCGRSNAWLCAVAARTPARPAYPQPELSAYLGRRPGWRACRSAEARRASQPGPASQPRSPTTSNCTTQAARRHQHARQRAAGPWLSDGPGAGRWLAAQPVSHAWLLQLPPQVLRCLARRRAWLAES